MFMMDECVGHMTEKVVIPPAEEIDLVPRRYTKVPAEEFLPYKVDEDLIPECPPTGLGYKFHVTGLTHDLRECFGAEFAGEGLVGHAAPLRLN